MRRLMKVCTTSGKSSGLKWIFNKARTEIWKEQRSTKSLILERSAVDTVACESSKTHMQSFSQYWWLARTLYARTSYARHYQDCYIGHNEKAISCMQCQISSVYPIVNESYCPGRYLGNGFHWQLNSDFWNAKGERLSVESTQRRIEGQTWQKGPCLLSW